MGYLLFTSQATGQMTNTKELSHKKYGGDPRFKNYTERVPLIFPWDSGPGTEQNTRLELSSLEPHDNNVEYIVPSVLAFMFALLCLMTLRRFGKSARGFLKPLAHA